MIGKLAFTLLILGASAGFCVDQSAVSLSHSSFDFGMIPDGSTLAHTVWIKSTAKDSVEISDIKSGCGCILIPASVSTLLPSDSLPITFVWDVSESTGTTTRQPYIFTNASIEPLKFALKAFVTSPADSLVQVRALPQQIDLSSKSGQKSARASFSIFNQTNQTLTAKIISLSNADLLAKLPNSIKANDRVVGSLAYERIETVTADPLHYRKSASLTIEVTNPAGKKTRLTIPIILETTRTRI